MRKVVVILGSILFAIALVMSGAVVYTRVAPIPAADKTSSDDINVLLTRPADWQDLVDQPIVTEADMGMIDGSTATIPITAELLRQFFDYSDKEVQGSGIVEHSTTHQAYLHLIDRLNRFGLDEQVQVSWPPISLVFASPPSDDELQHAKSQGVELEITAMARDGFVFITHKDNPVDALTSEQIRGIYSGAITNWSQVGGEDRPISAYQREPDSGSQTTMEQLVMDGQPMLPPIATLQPQNMGALVDAVAEYDNGPASIGYTFNYYVHNLYRNDQIKLISVDGIAPSSQTIANGSYPFSMSGVAAIRADEPADSPARRLRDFLLSPTGQAVIAQTGYTRLAG